MSYSLNSLYDAIGISKQAVHKYARRQLVFNDQLELLLLEAQELRAEHPGCGVEKMYYTLMPDFMGRDKFIEIFRDLGFRLQPVKNFRRTTYSVANHYSNLIKGMAVDRPSLIWQSDITYIYVGEQFYYAVFIIDVYTKKIVGYQVSDHMRGSANIKALEMAFDNHEPPVIHHSDRGSQYVYREYIKRLIDKNCKVSMAISAQDNAYAERINKTIKEEYLDYWLPKDFKELKSQIEKAVLHYNTKRLHNNLAKLTPKEFEYKWKNNQLNKTHIFKIFEEDA